MDRARWERVQELFHQAVDLPVPDREAFLAKACGGDASLRAEVASLLHGDADDASLLDGDVGRVAVALFPPARSAPVPPHAFGPYRLVRLLGEGGMGVVYLANRADLGSEAAVKVLRDAWLSPARRQRFVAEQRTLAQLNHPAIARLYDAGTLADGTPWIAMERVDGAPLNEYCRRQRCTLRQRLQLVRATSEAVLHAHQHLVIHRDLKPSNVFVRGDGTVKLLDFGIAKQLADDGDDDVTRTVAPPMTPAYAAPEQVTGERVGVHSDVYSLGVMLYELLAGVLPFDLAQRTPASAEAVIVAGNPVRPSQREAPGRVAATRAEWDELDVLCLTAMHHDPARRYRSVEALLRDIDHFLAGEPLEARGDSLGYRTAKFLRRNARTVAATSAAAVALVALVGFYTLRLAQARDAALVESVRAQRIQRFMSTLFQGGDEAAGPAESLRVVTLLDQGVAAARALDLEPRVQADLYQTLGGIYRQLGKLGRADSLLSTGLAQWRRVAGEASAEAGRAMVALGDLRTTQARYDEGERLLRAGIATLARSRDTGDRGLVEAHTALGRALVERGEHTRAIAALDTVVALLRDRPDGRRELHEALGELANAHFYAGDYDVADSLNRRVLAMTRALYGDRHPRVAEDLMNLGATEQERGHYREAERYFREALAISSAFYGEDHYRTAGNLTYLGRSLLFQNRYADARQPFERALAIRERVFGAWHPNVANTLNELGSLAMREERYEVAARAFTRVRAIYQRAYPGRNYRTGVATGNLADTYLYRKDYRRAEALYREALDIYIASQGPAHLNTGIGYIKLGRCLLRSGRFAAAVSESERGYAIVAEIASPDVSYLQAARLDLSLALDSLGRGEEAARYRAERERYLPRPAAK
ncbi:MAG: hypothetical protein AMXMBFR55_10690 [Gemmatimonadota bacterium]